MTGHHLDFDDDELDGRQLLLEDMERDEARPEAGEGARLAAAGKASGPSPSAEPCVGGRQALEEDLERDVD